jgi:hypothetical protein
MSSETAKGELKNDPIQFSLMLLTSAWPHTYDTSIFESGTSHKNE